MDSARCLVTGGGGFVGGALCRKLIESGCEVRSVSRGDYPLLRDIGVKTYRGDLAGDPAVYRDAFDGVEVVFHTAAKVDMWGRYRDFYEINVTATRNVIKLCREYKIPSLIYTSSPSVIARDDDLCEVDESISYPDRYLAFYPATKAIAEREVLKANGAGGLHTVALRPHLIWGPGDRHLVPAILEKARRGRLRIIGDGTNKVDLCFIDDCVNAHLLAFEKLRSGEFKVAGEAYFIASGRPVRLWDWINGVLRENGLAPVKKRIPAPLAGSVAWFLEFVYTLFRITAEPPLTRFLVSQMSHHHYFSIQKARQYLDYQPLSRK